MRWSKFLGLTFWPALVRSLASTDSIQNVDPPQSGYLPNHNINPNTISSLKIQYTNTYNTNEVFYAKPLVYTPTGYASELVITVSNQNIVRIIDGLTGTLINSRTLDAPFASVDTNCGDIPNTVGITGTPIIDPTTDTLYFFSKGYKNGAAGPQGTINGQYKFYALSLPSLQDVLGFPVIIDGQAANNDATRYFVGGTVLQRPGLAAVGNIIVGGFGGHCDNFNYTGMLVAVSKTAGVGVTNVIAMEAQPGAPSPQALDITVQGGGKAGIWQSGMGIATDGNRVFFATGNGRGAGDNGKGLPANGKVPISTLEQVVANFAVDPSTGVLTQSDYFEPYEYNNLNGGDRDFGSSGVSLLDPGTFKGKPGSGINRLAMAGGKSGKVYVLDADNLGGYANGPSNQDAVIQTILNGNSLFSGIGSYPLEGGYIYYNPTGDLLYCYQFGYDGSGNPLFTLAGQSASPFAGKSVPTITSFNGQAGTGIVWLADGNAGLTAFHAVPVNGVLQPITVPQTGGLTKFQRPSFGNGRIYVTHANVLVAIGASGSSLSSSSTSSSTSLTSSSSSISSSTSTTSSTTPSTASSTASSTTSLTTTSTSTSSSISPSSSASSTSTGPSSNTAITTTSSSTTSQTSISTIPTGSSTYQYIGCFQDTSSGHALPLLVANSSMTPELCEAYVQSLATAPTPTVLPYFYLEYHMECYGGSVFNFGSSSVTSLTGANACTDVCSGSIGAATTGTAKCGGAKQFNLYAKDGVVAWQGQTTTYSISGSSISSSTLSSSSSSSSSSSTSSTKTSTTSSSTSTTSLSTSTTSSPTSATSSPASTTSSSTSTTLSSASTTSSSTSTTLSSASTTLSSTSTTSSSTLTTSSSTSTGPSSNTATITTSSITTFVTSTTSASTAVQSTYQRIGCFEDTPTTHAMPLLFANNSMTPELCAAYVQSLATAPTPTVLPYFYLEYHRECYGGSVFNLGSSSVTNVASLVTASACTDVCSGSIGAATTGTAKCGGAKQFDLYTITPTSSSSTSSASPTSSGTVSYNWNIDWVSAAPDGVQRPFVGVNGQWPCPALNVNVGDIVQLNVYNNLVNETTAIHFHGIQQRGTNQMDGPAMVTQCSIPPGGSFVYQFQINQTGTYWYHAHVGGQYMDGFRGPLIVHDPAAPFQFDQEIVMTLSDLYHDQAPYLINYYQSPTNENLNAGAEPVPNATLINEAQNVNFNMVPGKTYLFRIINMGVFASQWLQFDQHEMTVVEADGVYTQPYNVSQLFITVAQRYSVIVKAKADNSQNYAIVASMMTDMFNPNVIPPNLITTVTSWLVYDPTKALPPAFTLQPQVFNDALFLPYDQQPLLGPVTYPITLTADFGPNDNNQQRANFNGISFVPQKVPTLYTALSAPANVVNNPTIYGVNSNPYVIPYGAVVELYISNHDSNAHPFHLHGHQFQVVDRSGGGYYFPGIATPDPPIPMRRDVVLVPGGGYAVIRFVADNPGITLFHCHIEWHVEAGLTATFIEAPDKLQAMNLVIPGSHKAVCANQGILMSGNAAGNSTDWLNLAGANTDPPLNAWGALVNPPS